jgi:hypothetical protein
MGAVRASAYSMGLTGLSAGSGKRLSRTQILNTFKSELREYRLLQVGAGCWLAGCVCIWVCTGAGVAGSVLLLLPGSGALLACSNSTALHACILNIASPSAHCACPCRCLSAPGAGGAVHLDRRLC